jgi:hypothetical protein
MYSPQFPYKSDQVIISSDRVLLHSKNDAIFLFGKQAVSLSSPQTINLDASQKVLIDSPKIELGHKAEQDGEPVVLGEKLNEQLLDLTIAIQTAAVMLSQASTTNLGAAMQSIRNAGQILYDASENSKVYIQEKITLSKNTFTR